MSILYLLLFFVGAVVLLAFLSPKGNKPSARALRELGTRPVTPIAQAQPGRVKLRGTARAARTEASLVGQIACLALRRTIMTQSGNRVTVRTQEWTFPFELGDGTGKILIATRDALLDYEPLTTGNTKEECLRDGATLAVIGDLVPAADAGEGPFRFAKPPLISWRCDPEDAPRGGWLPVSLVVSSVLMLGGLVGSVREYLTGDKSELDILVHVTPALVIGLALVAWRMFRED